MSQWLTSCCRRSGHHDEFPSLEETLQHPSYPSTIWALLPKSKGKLAVAEDRGGPWDIVWEVHGTGPVKLCVRNDARLYL